MNKVIIFLVFFFSFGMINAQTKSDEIRELIRLTRVQESAELMVDATINYFSSQKSNVPQSIWESIKDEVDYNSYLKKIEPIYDIQFTLQELKELNLFFKTSVGKKYINTMPVINQDIYLVGKKFGQEFGQVVTKKLQSLGY